MKEIFDQVLGKVTEFGPNVVGALLILFLGWLVALVAAKVVRSLLLRTKVDNKIAAWMGAKDSEKPIPVEKWAGTAVFLLIMFFVVGAFFQSLKLTAITGPLDSLLSSLTAYFPRLLGGAILAFLAWLVATIVRRLARVVLEAAKVDEKLGGAMGEKEAPAKASMSKVLSDALYWVVLLLFLPLILGALELQSLLDPVQAMFNRFFAFLPSLIAGAVILLVGWFVARIVGRMVGSLLAAAGVDRASKKWGLAKSLGQQTLSGLIGQVLYFLILIPVLIAGLNALELKAVADPATAMLGKILDFIPGLVGALFILAVAYFVGRLVSNLLAGLLAGVGFDRLPGKLGLPKQPKNQTRRPSALAGGLVLVVIMLLSGIEAAKLMGLTQVSDLILSFLVFASHVLMGLIIFCLGLALANWVAKVLRSSRSRSASMYAGLAQAVILILAGAMALRQMNLANEIVNLAFGLLLGAAAVAAAIAFGLGGREAAGRILADWGKGLGRTRTARKRVAVRTRTRR